MKKIVIAINRVVVQQGQPIQVDYMLTDQQKIDMLNLEHFPDSELTDLIGIDEKHLGVAQEFQQALRAYSSLAGGEDLVRLKIFFLSEVKRIIEERFQQYGCDVFGKRIDFKGGL